MPDRPLEPVPIDVGQLVQRSLASLYSHLVTRPTGRAVRMAIESQLSEAGRPALSLVDLSQVTVLDFSCADEVVAKLLLRCLEGEAPLDAFVVLRGVRDLHRDPIQAVLERQRLAAVAEVESGGFELLGTHTGEEGRVWTLLEGRGRITREEIAGAVGAEGSETLDRLVRRRVAFAEGEDGAYYALSRLIGGVGG